MRHRVRIGLLEQVCGLLKETASLEIGIRRIKTLSVTFPRRVPTFKSRSRDFRDA